MSVRKWMFAGALLLAAGLSSLLSLIHISEHTRLDVI